MKALRKSVKYSLALLALAVLGLLAAPLFISMDDIKSRIEQEVEDATGRALTIGDIKASLFPWIGVHLADVRLANREGFSDAPFFRADSIDVKVALVPLLGGRYEVRNFTVVAPEFELERHADGRTNWDDLIGGSAMGGGQAANAGEGGGKSGGKGDKQGEPAAGKQPAALPAFLAESIRIERGRLIWRDAAQAGAPLAVEDLSLALDDVRFDRPVRFRVSAKALGAPLSVQGEFGPVGAPESLDPARLPVRAAWTWRGVSPSAWSRLASLWPEALKDWGLGADRAKVSLEGSFEQHADGLRAVKGSVDLAGGHEFALAWTLDMPDAKRVNIQSLNLAVDGRDWLQGQGSLRLAKRLRWRMRLKSARIERGWLAAFAPALDSLYAAHPAPWKQIAFGAMLAGDASRIDIRDLQLRLDGELVQVSGALRLPEGKRAGPDVRLRVAAKTLHLDPWLPKGEAKPAAHASSGADAGARPSAAAPADAAPERRATPPAEPDLRFLTSWRVDVRAQIGRLLAGGLDAGDLQVVIAGKDGRFTLDPLRFTLSGGLVEEKAELDASVWPARWRESARVSRVNLGPLLKSAAGMDWLEGRLDMRTHLRGVGLTPRAAGTLSGDGRLQLHEGRIRGVDLVAMLQALGKGGLGAKAGTRFTQISASFTAKRGVIESRDLFMVSPYLRVNGQGVVNLAAKTLDWRLRPRLVGGGKGVVIPVRIKGPLNAPAITPDLDAKTLIGEALRHGGAKPVEKLRKSLDKQLGGALKGLLPGLP